MNALIVGQGSIGKKHLQALEELGVPVITVSKHSPKSEKNFNSLSDAFEKQTWDYIVLANSTSEHVNALKEISARSAQAQILVEKPLFKSVAEAAAVDCQELSVFVGYQLRMHPGLQRLKQLLSNKTVCSVSAYVGQNLKTWRAGRDYRQSYSADRKQGGGVLRDLSHELDYLQWLFGLPTHLFAQIGKYSDLEIDSEDTVATIMRTEHCPQLSLEMNYVDHLKQRHVTVNCTDETYRLDFVTGELRSSSETLHYGVTGLELLKEQHQNMIASTTELLCSYGQAIEVQQTIENIEKSNLSGQWLNL